MSLGAVASARADRVQVVGEVLRRGTLIVGLGIFLNGFPLFDWSTLRIPGVLQRIARCYCGAALVLLAADVRGQAITAAPLVVGYWGLMRVVECGCDGRTVGARDQRPPRARRGRQRATTRRCGADIGGQVTRLPASMVPRPSIGNAHCVGYALDL